MPVTLKDIADQTGVSPSVVFSTVLSGRDNGTFVSVTIRESASLQSRSGAQLYASARWTSPWLTGG